MESNIDNKKSWFSFFSLQSKKEYNASDAETDLNIQSTLVGCFFVLKMAVILDSPSVEGATEGDLLLIP